jgi:hypothetical protein
MFGGIAAAGTDHVVYAVFDGTVVTLDTAGTVTGQFTVFPCGPEKVHVSACAVADDGAILLGDARNLHVRRFDPAGRQTIVYGGRPTPGLEQQDVAGVLDEPCAILPLDDALVVACGGIAMRHGVQRFAAEGSYLGSLPRPPGWKRAQGLALVDGLIWVAETDAGIIRRFTADGRHQDDVELHPDLRRPLRIAADNHGGVLMVLAPETEAEQEGYGVARLRRDGEFDGWAVKAGDRSGAVFCPYDLAVLPDGRFVVADLPLGEPPEVRLQLFSADGRLVAGLLGGTDDLQQAQRAWFESLLARTDGGSGTLLEQARVHHFHGGGETGHLEIARRLYLQVLAAEPGHYLAHLHLAALLEKGIGDPAAAELSYRAALGAGGPEGDLKARIAACRHAQGDLDGAVQVLQDAIECPEPPEDYHAAVEELGTYYLERSGETA